MDKPEKLVTKKTVVFDVMATLIFFAIMFPIVRPHVPEESMPWNVIWTVYTVACLSGVFFIASCMFHAVLVDQIRRNRSHNT